MVVASLLQVVQNERVEAINVPVVDLSAKRAHVSGDMVKACEEFGFFKVVNHGVPMDIVMKMEAMGLDFFSLPSYEKQMSGPPNPLGYGSRNIGFTGDAGEVEYLLLHTNPNSLSQRAKGICSKHPENFSCVMSEYVEAVKELACVILDILAGGVGIEDSKVFSRFIRDRESDSLIRLNHYPGANHTHHSNSTATVTTTATATATATAAATIVKGDYCAGGREIEQGLLNPKVGFGEHCDPQILTVLRSNDVAGLQILSTDDKVWVPVPPDPNAFFVNVGDTLQALTNGRFVSVRHRAMASSHCSRLSLVYFGAPPLHARVAPLPEMITPSRPRRYRSFTWGEYKKAMYSLRLGYDRLNHFQLEDGDDEPEPETEPTYS